MPRNRLIRPRGGTAAAWTAANPVLAQREHGVESDTGRSKVGDGSTPWSSLAYATPSAAQVNNLAWQVVPAIGEFVAPPTISVTSTSVLGVGTERLAAIYVPVAMTFDRIRFEVVTGQAAALFRPIIRPDNGFMYPSSSVALDAGAVDCSAANAALDTTINLALAAGWYWIGGAVQGGATQPTLRVIGGGLLNVSQGTVNQPTQSGWSQSGVTGAAGAFSATRTVVGTVPRVLLRRSA